MDTPKLDTPKLDTLGIVECRTIAGGVAATDAMLKAARVELTRATTICSGRYLIFVAGDRDTVETSVLAAQNLAQATGRGLTGSFVLSNVSPLVTAAIKRSTPALPGNAVAVVEARTASVGIAAADAAVKYAPVRLLRLVAGQGITGKSYFVLAGDVSAVQEGANAAKTALGKQLVDWVVIPNPEEPLLASLAGR